MNYSRNDVFCWTKYGEKKTYRLVLHCGSPQYFDQLKEIELPWNSLIGDIELEDGYEKGIPFGMRNACTTKIKFDIFALRQSGYGDVWNYLRSNSKDVGYREWEGVDTEKYLVKDFRMVNCFVLQYWDETYTEWRNENVFVQSPVSESTIKVESGKSTFEIELYSIHKYVMEKVNFQFFNPIWWYDKQNYLQPQVRALMGLQEVDDLDYSSRRYSLLNSGEKKYWCILNNLQTTMNNNQTFVKHSFHIQDARSGSGQMLHLRLMPIKNLFKTMNFAAYNILKLITRCGKVWTESQMRNFGFPNPVLSDNFELFKPTHTDDNTHGALIDNNKLFITESIYKAITDGTAGTQYKDAQCQYYSNPLYSKFSNAWNFFVEFYAAYPSHIDFNPKTCRFDMRTLFFNNSTRDIISSEIQSDNLEYTKLNDAYNNYLMKANVCSTNSNSNVVLNQSTSDSGKKVQSTQYLNCWNDKGGSDPYYWHNPQNTFYQYDTRTIYNEKNIGSFPVGKIIYRHTDYNIDVFDGNQKQLFICPSHHVESVYVDIPQTYSPVNGVVNSFEDLYRWLDQTNANGFTAYSNQLLSNYLLNKGESAILKFNSKEYFSLTDIGLPFGIRMNELFKIFVDLPIDSKDYRYCHVTNIKKNYSTDKSEITIFIRGDEYQNL